MLYFGLFLGVIIYALMDFNGFAGNFMTYIQNKNNVITVILNALVGTALIIGWQQDETMLESIGITQVNFKDAVLFGITGHALIEKIVKGFDKRTSTKLGLNK